MSKEQLGEFHQLVVTNVELQEEIKLALTPAAVVDIAKKQGFEVSTVDVLRKQAEAIADLSDGELETISGGAGLAGGFKLFVTVWAGLGTIAVPALVAAYVYREKQEGE